MRHERTKRAGCGPAAAGLVGFVLGAATVLLVVWATLRPDTWQGGPAPVVPGGESQATVPGGLPQAPARPQPGARRQAPPRGLQPRPQIITPIGHVKPDLPVLPPPPDLRRRDLLLPVEGIDRDELSDTFADARGSGRSHEAIDIMAPRGTPVLAVDDGKIAKLFSSELGGLTVYQFDPTGNYAYYYAHLDRYAPGLAAGTPIRRGRLLGYVGSTGNAGEDSPHLHFAVFRLGPEKRWWQGTPINPYTLFSDDLAETAPPAR